MDFQKLLSDAGLTGFDANRPRYSEAGRVDYVRFLNTETGEYALFKRIIPLSEFVGEPDGPAPVLRWRFEGKFRFAGTEW